MTTPTAVKTHMIRIRVDPRVHAELVWAARQENLDLSAWLRRLGLRRSEQLRKKAHK